MGRFVILVTLAFGAANHPGDEAVEATRKPWFELAVGEHGEPDYVFSKNLNRAQREVLWQFRTCVTELKDVEEIEKELNAALADTSRDGGYGYTYNGDWWLDFRSDGRRAILSISYDSEAEEDDRYPNPPRQLEMPLAEFTEFFRAWAESVRHWKALGGKRGFPLPADKWPTRYPPVRNA